MNSVIIGLFMAGPNPSACLLVDGHMIAFVEEERFVRVKKATGYLPIESIKYCLHAGNMTLGDVNYFAVGWDYTKYPEFMEKFHQKTFPKRPKVDMLGHQIEMKKFDPELVEYNLAVSLRSAGIKGTLPQVKYTPHHLAHAASSYYLSGFEAATILTIDGSGEEHSTVIWHGKGKNIEQVATINIPHSLGWFYAALTEFIGFSAYSDEGKTMGLAPYGRENMEIRQKLSQIVQVNKGGYIVDPSYFFFDKRSYSKRFTDKLVDLLGEPHLKGTVHTQYYQDVAFEAQYLLERTVVELVSGGIDKTGERNVCIAGGLGMNCKMNGRINQMEQVDKVFVIPASSDDGTSIGAALQLYRELGGNPQKNQLKHTYYGPEFSNESIRQVLDEAKVGYRYVDDIEQLVAQKLADDKIIGWFQGRMEFGARALGNRSILANPLNIKMKEIINAQVKHREAFRPFCPSILLEDRDIYLKNAQESPYMIVAYEVNEQMQEKIPAVVHVDNTVRPQTVNKQYNERYWNLLNEFKKITGCSVVLNTSFNTMGEPIVCKPNEALRCFFSGGLDCLALGNYFIEKKSQSA